MGTRLEIRPRPDSFATRTLDELVGCLRELGELEPSGETGTFRWRPEEAGPVEVRATERDGALDAVELELATGVAREQALELAAQVAGPLHWDVVDPASGARHTPHELDRERRRGRAARLRSALAGISAGAAVLGVLAWRATGGGQSPWLLLGLLGIAAYLSLRASTWIRSRLGPPGGS